MVYQTRLFWLTVTISIASTYSSTKVVTIQEDGHDVTSCTEGLTPCHSLGFAARYFSNHDDVVFLVKEKVDLQEVVSFQSSANITILGIGEYSELICSSNCGSCGLEFLHTRSILLQNLTITGCGALGNFSSHETLQYKSAVILRNCSDVSLNNVTVQDSRGYGAVLLHSVGNVKISQSYFLNSTTDGELLGGAGMRIIMSLCDVLDTECDSVAAFTPASYVISNSVFRDNSALHDRLRKPWNLHYGGGLGISHWWRATDNNVTIIDTDFINNRSPCGGGLSVEFNMDSTDNVFQARGCTFAENSEMLMPSLGGAGLAVGTTSDDYVHFPLRNTMLFDDCNFSHNRGHYGAGTAVYSAASETNTSYQSNSLQFTDCLWEYNVGDVSPAIDIDPDFFSTLHSSFILNVTFESCTFSNNKIDSHLRQQDNPYQYHSAPGVFLITRLKVYFYGEILFENNTGCALVLFSASAVFGDGARASFTNNTGDRGGALILFEFSSLRYWNNTEFNFTGNRASTMGGAMYVYKAAEHLRVSSHTCFIGYANPRAHKANFNIHFYFDNNTADSNFANTMFVNSLKPCQFHCMVDYWTLPSVGELFGNNSCLGHFHFTIGLQKQIGTEGASFNLIKPPPYHFIPGRQYKMPIQILDELNNDALPVTVLQSNLSPESPASIDPAFLYVTDNKIKFEGSPGSKGNLSLVGIRSFTGVSIPIEIAPCAPGYVTTTGPNNLDVCACSSTLDNSRYQGVLTCNETAGIALIAPGLWIGYITDGQPNEDNLYTGFCVHGYCNDFVISVNTAKQFPLISNASKEGLVKRVCAENRHGILCGKCTANNSVYYHSNSFQCNSNSLCSYGPLFYILSELLPTVVLFLAIMFFDISLTSGYAYSIVFMLQMLQATMRVTLVSGAQYHNLSFIEIAITIYSIFNLDFFALEELSFCLWAGATTMDMLVMKYVTVLFALGLIVSTILLVNYCSCDRLRKYLIRKNKQQPFKQHSIVQGITAFLVICYSQCTLIAFYSLTSATITGKGGKQYNNTSTYFDGTISYFSLEHLPFALPAVLVLFTIVIPLPVILFGDPFFLKLEYFANRRFFPTKNLYPWTRFRQKFKPLFDSFQGCFKDEYRFTSGLFFIYRIVILLSLILSPGLDWFYGSLQIILIVIFTVQALLHPFQNSKHNVMSVFVIMYFLLINSCSIVIFMLVYGGVHVNSVDALEWVQLGLVYLPIACGLIWLGWKSYKIIKAVCRKGRFCTYTELDDDRMLDESLGYLDRRKVTINDND